MMCISIAIIEKSIEILKKKKKRKKLPDDSANPLLNIYPKEIIQFAVDNCTSVFTIILFTIGRKKKQSVYW